MILTVVFYIFVAVTAIQIIYYFYFSSILFQRKKKSITVEEHPISVIIFVKNSAENLKKNLQYVLNQEYSKFEIILINNFSTDTTAQIIEEFKTKNDNITIVDVENTEAFWGSKKYALTLGIKAAKYNHLLFTKPNSRPTSKYWLAEMSKTFEPEKTIILGYEKFKVKSSLTNILARFHNLIFGMFNFSFLKSSTPFMAFDSNFGYERKTFFKVKGFINHIKIQRGENNLFLKDAARNENVNYAISKDSIVEIDAPDSFISWFRLLIEQRNLQELYKFKHRFSISLFWLSKMLFFILGSVLFFFYPWQIILPITLGYFLVLYIVIGFSAKKLQEPYLIFFLPFLEIGLLLIQFSIFIANLFTKSKN